MCKHVNSRREHTEAIKCWHRQAHRMGSMLRTPLSSLSELHRGGRFPRVIWYLPKAPELASAPLYGQGGGTAWFLYTPSPQAYTTRACAASATPSCSSSWETTNHLPQDLHRRHFGPPRGHPGGHRYPAAMKSPHNPRSNVNKAG